MHDVSTQPFAMIRIDEIWLATEPLDMRAGPDTALARVVQVYGSATVVDASAQSTKQPKRAPLPPELPRTLIHHEPESTQCNCGCQLKRVGEGVSEKLAYVPGEFTVERHIRGKWACAQCETLIQAPVPGTCSSH